MELLKPRFTFKSEVIWNLILFLGILAFGFVVAVVLWLIEGIFGS